MKRIAIVLGMMLAMGGLVYAANPENISITVSITQGQDLTIDGGSTIDFGPMAPAAAASVAASSTVVRNSGTGAPETLKINADTSAGALATWTIVADTSTAVGNETCLLQAAVHATLPASAAEFNARTNIVADGGTGTTCSATVHSLDGTSTGAGIAYDTTRAIWWLFQPPTITTVSGATSITVVVTAIP